MRFHCILVNADLHVHAHMHACLTAGYRTFQTKELNYIKLNSPLQFITYVIVRHLIHEIWAGFRNLRVRVAYLSLIRVLYTQWDKVF